MYYEYKIPVPDDIKGIMARLLDNDYEAFIVGGAIRDFIVGKRPKDYDIFTNATGAEILDVFPNGKVLGGPERQEKILTVIVDGIEVSSYRANPERTEPGTSLYDHLATCDFSFNAMYADADGNITDLHGGARDLSDGAISCVGPAEKRIAEDPLRVLRAVRFIARFNIGMSKVESGLYNELTNPDLSGIPPERIHDELMRILEFELGAETLVRYGLLYRIIPEFSGLNVDGGRHHAESVMDHSLLAFMHARRLTSNTLLCLACLFHDLGKGPCRTFVDESFEDDDIPAVHFKKHDMVGSELCREIMARLCFSKADTDYVATLVARHMFGFNREHRKSAYVHLFQALEDNNVPLQDMLLLNYCDGRANLKNTAECYHDYLARSDMLRKYYEMKYTRVPFRVKDLDVNGHDVMSFGIPAGPRVGEMLNGLFETVCRGELRNERAELMLALRLMVEKSNERVALLECITKMVKEI